jgi:hypothetical protein
LKYYKSPNDLTNEDKEIKNLAKELFKADSIEQVKTIIQKGVVLARKCTQAGM